MVMLAAWYGLLAFFRLDPYFAKSPNDLWSYLIANPAAETHRLALLGPLQVTLRDALLGYMAGTVSAILCACAFLLWTPLQRTLLPILLATQSVPLLAMTPLIVLLFGRGLTGVTVVTGLVTFFPTLVNLGAAMRNQEPVLVELFTAFGASRAAIVRKLLLPSAVPALLASLRIAVPRALLGALLAEWLATGEGLGQLMVVSMTTAEYAQLWSSVILLGASSFIVYTAVQEIEQRLLISYGWRRAERSA